MSKRIVAVICGGFTAEKNISILSGGVVYDNINRDLYEPFKVIIGDDNWVVEPGFEIIDKNDFSCVVGGRKIKFDCVFNAIHGSPGEDGKIQGYFDMLGIPYTNSGVASSSLTFNKYWTKEVLKGFVPMAKGMLIKRNTPDLAGSVAEITRSFSVPLFVKPNNNGSSYGITRVKEMDTLESAIAEALQYDDEVLVEEGVSGTEVTCGVYRHKGRSIVLPICEIVADKHEFFDYTAKYTTGESDEIIPARITPEESELVSSYSSGIYERLNCRGVVRIDYILHAGIPHMLEVNSVPGLSENSIVPKMAKAAGINLSGFFDLLLEESFVP
jgi:D-alanine-D-alanine ligase